MSQRPQASRQGSPPLADDAAGPLHGVVERLRRDFDQAFARPASTTQAAGETVLSVRLRDDPFAVRLSQIGGLFADRPVTRLPGPFPDLLGLAGFRGALVPVFDLGALLGYPRAASARWLLLTPGGAPVGLAFDVFEHTEVLPAEAFEAGTRPAAGGDPHVVQLARTADGPRPLVDIPSILTVIDSRTRKPG